MPEPAQMLDLYERMVRCMLWEQGLLRMIEEGKISGFFHAGRGQEGVQVGAMTALGPRDSLLYAHRGCGYMIARGLSMEKLYGDFLANTAGTTRGLGAGIVHIAWPELGILGQSGTLGGCFPIAAGAGLAARYRGTDQVVLCFFGDGTANRGTFHEAANAAAVWKLPVVWLCENNGWAVSVSAREACSVERIADRASAYGMPGQVVDGQDVAAVHDAVSEAIRRARQGEGPSLIEAVTQRFRGHFEGDPDTYRDRDEVERWRRDRDPIVLLAGRLQREGVASEADLEAIRGRVQGEVDEAAERALGAAMPDPGRIYQYVTA